MMINILFKRVFMSKQTRYLKVKYFKYYKLWLYFYASFGYRLSNMCDLTAVEFEFQ